MPQLLRRIRPSGKRRESAPPRIHRIDSSHQKNGESSRIPVAVEERRSSADCVRQLQGIRDEVEELLLLASACDCLRTAGRADDSSTKKYRTEARNVIVRLRKLLGVKMPQQTPPDVPTPTHSAGSKHLSPQASALSLTKRRSGTSRIQIRLTRALVKVLAAFNEAGQKPSGIVERLLWKDQDIRDAADILRIDIPEPQSCGRGNAPRDSQQSHVRDR
ncbi:MAG: hypothetical protein P8K08_17880 [Fuerstiella sp.]|jgi:hypothetical protein|nr:hypothetical protein [Fuerstiella sp.]